MVEVSRPRQAVFDALKAAAPGTFTEAMRQAFVADGLNVELAELEMDSLAQMEFCIALELSTGVTLVPSQLAELASTDAVERRIRDALG
jgi:acyl carrier protein